MAVDFSRLPAEVPVPDKGPSPLVWCLVFLVLALGGSLLVLGTWPSHTPTQTLWFWFCVAVIPVCLSGALALRPFAYFHKQQLQARTHNQLVKVHNDLLFERASVPLAVLASDYRVHTDPEHNTFEAITERSASLPTRATQDGRSSVVASYLEPDTALLAFDDETRQRAVLGWVLQEIGPVVATALQDLPEHVPVVAWLEVAASALNAEAVGSAWRALPESAWTSRLRSLTPVIQPTGGLCLADTMLDRADAKQRDVVTLLINVTLNGLHTDGPEPDSAEAASVLVLTSSELAHRLSLPAIGWFSRPQSDAPPPPGGAALRAIQWGRSTTDAVAGTLMQGAKDTDIAAVRTVLSASAAEGEPRNDKKDWLLDTLISNTGQTAPWLAAALALDRAAVAQAPLLVGSRTAQQMLFAVVTPAERPTSQDEVENDA
jgi:hypothetical protein